jgi:malonyl-CoA decarboxylase
MDAPARGEFFDQLVKGFSPDPLEVGRVGDAYRRAPSPDNLASLLRVVEPRRQELFRRLNHAPEGTRGLVEMRAQLLEDLKENPSWKPIEADLAHLLGSWFNRGFLTLRRIDWRTSAFWTSSSTMKPCMRSGAGTISGEDWMRIAVATRSFILRCRRTRSYSSK